MYAVLTAFTWAIAVVLFKRSGESLPAPALNYFKNCVGLVLLLATVALSGEPFWPSPIVTDVVALMVSGALGIGLADTLFFHGLNRLGASRTAVIECLYSPAVVLFSAVFLGERPTLMHLGGGALIMVGVALATRSERSVPTAAPELVRGVVEVAVAMLLMAAGIVLAKPILARYAVVWSTSARMVGGLAVLSLIALVHGPTGVVTRAAFRPQRAWRFALPAAVIGSYVALLFWIAGFKYASASTAAILNQTSTLFTVFFAAVFLRERFGLLHAVAVGLAFCGSVLVLV